MSGHNRIKSLSAAGGACLSLALLAGFGPAGGAPSASTGWRVVASTPTIAPGGIVAQSRHGAWMLGGGFTLAQPQSDFPAGLHWNGRTWSKVGPASFPMAIRNTGIGCAAKSSAANVWAFAGTTNAGSFAASAGALRLEGGRWKLVKQFPAGLVTGCLVESPTEVWVFGDGHVAPGIGTWHLHGRTWRHFITSGYVLDQASAVNASDVWAEGDDSFLNPVVARWNGRSWVRNTKLSKLLPKTSANVELFLGGITARGRDDVWFRVDVLRDPSGHATLSVIVVHWNGRAWHKASPAAFGYYLPGAVPDGHGGWWADIVVAPSKRVVLHAVRGRWFKVPVSIRGCTTGQLTQVAPVPGSMSVLGVQQCPSKSAPPVVHVLLRGPRL